MGLLNDRRRVMGAKGLPYDSEIEYLEVSEEGGHAWIDTEYTPQGKDICFDMTFMIKGYTKNTGLAFYSNYLSASTGFYNFGNSSGNNWDLFHGSNTSVKLPIGLNTKYRLFINGNDRTYQLNQQTGPITAFVSDSSLSLALFRSTRTDNEIIYGRYYYFKVYHEDTLVLDLIPVRKGNKGYMYDKVSGKLFGNVGVEGSYFILGPDVVKPYDAEVEYLEVNKDSGGTPHIVTDIILNDGPNYIIESELMIFGRTKVGVGNPSFFDNGMESDERDKYGLMYAASNNDTAALAYMATSRYIGAFNFNKNIKNKWTIDGFSKKVFRDDLAVTANWPSSTYYGNTQPMILFSDTEENMSYFRMYNFKVKNSDREIANLIPVRRGNTGYMYDRVNGRMYGNSGTGEFIIGPDIN